MSDADITIEPIGIVRNGITQRLRRGWEEIISEVIIDERWAEALHGVEEFSHILILFWMHRLTPQQRQVAQTHPECRQDLPLVGVLATRSPARPNPIGLSLVKLLERSGTLLKVKGLDAVDGSPVLDIKPYLPLGDSVAGARVPQWVEKLWTELRHTPT